MMARRRPTPGLVARHLTLSRTDGAGFAPITYTFTPADAGSHVFTATLNTAGNQTITVTAAKKGGTFGNSVGVTVTASGGGGGEIVIAPVVASVSVHGPATVQAVAAGSSASFSATVTDAYGNPLTDGQVTWSTTGGTISSGGVLTPDATASCATVTATVQAVAGKLSGSTTIAITGGSTGRPPVVTSDRGTISDSTQPTPASSTVLTQPVVISASGTVTATFHVPNAPQDGSTYYWDANLKQWIAVPTTFALTAPWPRSRRVCRSP